MILIKKLWNIYIPMDEKLTQMRLGGIAIAVTAFSAIAVLNSSGVTASFMRLYADTLSIKSEIHEAKSQHENLKQDIESLSLQLPFADMFKTKKQAELFLEEKIEAFNTNNGFKISAKKTEQIECDGIKPYYRAKLGFENANNANAMIALIYFEKIGFIESFESGEMILYFNNAEKKI